ncbi:MAG: methylenetetrahydrofolate reductase [Halobacteriales archaeon]
MATHQPTPVDRGVRTLLAEPKFELMPFASFWDQAAHLPDGATIAITTSPKLGLDTTIERAEAAAAEGYTPIPHIAARFVEDRDHLEAIAGRLTEAGVDDILVIGGDAEEPVGEYESSYRFLEALAETDHAFDAVGIAGYPEGHEFLSDETLAEAMAKKAPHATYIVTQLCYDAGAIIDWLEDVRGRGIELPVDVGVPGVLKYQRLLEISRQVGVGDSVRFLQKTSGVLDFVRQFIGSRGKYTPTDLVEGLAPYVDDPEYGIRNSHLYTFNQVADTEDWRRSMLER